MARGFPLRVQNTLIHSGEALYQSCRFPHLPEVQRLTISQSRPMNAKLKGRAYSTESRLDWNHVPVDVMRWCLRVKLAHNWDVTGFLLSGRRFAPWISSELTCVIDVRRRHAV